MIRGKSFYAVWDEERQLWSTDEYDVQRLVDKELFDYAEKRKSNTDEPLVVKAMADFSSTSWMNYRKYIANMSDNYHQLDDRIIFSNDKVTRKDYVSHKLSYPLEECPTPAYTEIMETLYDESERAKLEWAIGAIIAGDAKHIQKFIVLFGDPGTGKSTFLDIVQQLFEGYYSTFEAKALVTSTNAFATEMFRNNPLIAIQHDGDLSRIEDNTKINSIASHEEIVINEKYKSGYAIRMQCFMFLGTNKPVKITDAKSGIIRRLISATPSGRKIPSAKYRALKKQIPFELSGIAKHCLDVYDSMGPAYYDSYVPIDMIYKTDFFFNFVESYFEPFSTQEYVTLSQAYDMYRQYCSESSVSKVMPRYIFREELKNYFDDYKQFYREANGRSLRSVYIGFKRDRILGNKAEEEKPAKTDSDIPDWLQPLAQGQRSISKLDIMLTGCPTQYANKEGLPTKKWENVRTKLGDISTDCLHYVKVPENHIVIDFDLKDSDGNKDLMKNLKAASEWPRTYAELSKSGAGVHLHYNYLGDCTKLSCVYSDGIEVKVFGGNSALRRRLTSCNDLEVATISSGLPLKEKKVINFEAVKNEKQIRSLIAKNLAKEVWPGTKPSIDFIYKILDDAYSSGVHYDVTDMRQAVILFAAHSTHHPDYCLTQVNKMKFRSDEPSIDPGSDAPIVFFDCEVFKNLFLINWKYPGDENKCVRMINPSPQDVEGLFRYRLIGFNCRRYDNHILYGRYLGYTNEELYALSQRIINNSQNAMFGEAYNISYADVYDFSSVKQSLKKFEIELGIHHQELGIPWDEPVPESEWVKVAEYCDNDVIATEATFNHLKEDWMARQILADLADGSVNDSTNSLTTKLVFGDNKKPQLVYTDLATGVQTIGR